MEKYYPYPVIYDSKGWSKEQTKELVWNSLSEEELSGFVQKLTDKFSPTLNGTRFTYPEKWWACVAVEELLEEDEAIIRDHIGDAYIKLGYGMEKDHAECFPVKTYGENTLVLMGNAINADVAMGNFIAVRVFANIYTEKADESDSKLGTFYAKYTLKAFLENWQQCHPETFFTYDRNWLEHLEP